MFGSPEEEYSFDEKQFVALPRKRHKTGGILFHKNPFEGRKDKKRKLITENLFLNLFSCWRRPRPFLKLNPSKPHSNSRLLKTENPSTNWLGALGMKKKVDYSPQRRV